MTRGSASQQGATQEDDDQEEDPQHFEEAMGHWFDELEENIPYLEPEQPDLHQERVKEETPMPNQQNNNHYRQETEETPYPHDHHHEQMGVEEILVQLYYPNDDPPPDEMKKNNFQDHIFTVATIINNILQTMVIIKTRTRPLSSRLGLDELVKTSR